MPRSTLKDRLGLSPFQHAYGYDPVTHGMQGDFFTLIGGAAVFTVGALVLFDRRDVHV